MHKDAARRITAYNAGRITSILTYNAEIAVPIST